MLSLYRGGKPDTYDYIIGYCMGMMKNEIFFPQAAIQTNWYCDFLNFIRFQCRMLGAEELSAFLWPQLFCVSDESLSQDEFPALLNLNRESLESTGVYVLFNTFNVYLWIGKEVDPFFIDQLFGLETLEGVAAWEYSEEDIFFAEGQTEKGWVQELYAIIQQCRVSQKIYPSFQVL